MVNVGDFADDSASDVSSGENVDDDSQPGDLQSYYEDDRNVPPQEKQQYLMTLCFSSIEGFTTDVLPYSHRLFEKQKKKFKATVSLLKKEIKRRKPDFKGLSGGLKLISVSVVDFCCWRGISFGQKLKL